MTIEDRWQEYLKDVLEPTVLKHVSPSNRPRQLNFLRAIFFAGAASATSLILRHGTSAGEVAVDVHNAAIVQLVLSAKRN